MNKPQEQQTQKISEPAKAADKRPGNGKRKNRIIHPGKAEGGIEPSYFSMASMKDSDPYPVPSGQGILGEGRAQTIPKEWKFSTTHAGYMEIVDAEYDRLANNSTSWKKQVPKSLWYYYATEVFWARECAINARDSDRWTSEAEQLMQAFRHKQVPIPDVLSTYMRSLGNIFDKEGCWAARLGPQVPNLNGHVGRIDEVNHFRYETTPYPFISVECLKLTVRYSLNEYPGTVWDPPGLRPAAFNEYDARRVPAPAPLAVVAVNPVPRARRTVLDEEREDNAPTQQQAEGFHPTVNLLGWMPLEKLTNKQIKMFAELGITGNDMPTTIDRFLYNEKVMVYVADHLRLTQAALDLAPHKSLMGSLTQTFKTYARLGQDIRMRHLNNQVQVKSSADYGQKLTVAAGAFGLREVKTTKARRSNELGTPTRYFAADTFP